MITTLHAPLRKAVRGRYAIPAFNVTNLETAQVVLRAAAKLRSPVIVQTSESAIAYAGPETIISMLQTLAGELAPHVSVITHLDHGKHFHVAERCVTLGYTSIHMDASERPWSQNVAVTRRAVVLGHRRRITVQGELGYLLGYEGMTKINFDRGKLKALMTDPDQAAAFVAATGVDTLAIAVGTAHGFFRGKEKIDFDRLAAIQKKVSVPLVLHGGSGVSDAEIRRAIRTGIRIINLDTALRIHFLNGIQQAMAQYDPKTMVDIRAVMDAAQRSMAREAERLIKLVGSAQQA